MIANARRLGRKALAARGYQLAPANPPDYPADVRTIINRVATFTMTSPARVADTCEAVRYVADNAITGALVECGVWKGGNAMAMALQLHDLGVTDRDIWLYDTFAGMTEPSAADTHLRPLDYDVHDRWQAAQNGAANSWAYAPLDAVRAAMLSTGYPAHRVRYVVGPVETTIPVEVPDRIAVLRLDTDWYGSTRHELEHLYPRLATGGVLIIDDYGTWGGCRQAVDEYVAANNIRLFLHRSDDSGRIAIKQF